MVNLSEFTENLKSDRDTQITVALIIFFMIAFPAYFNYASNSVSSGGALGSVGDYRVTGEYTFIELDSGEEGIADGDTLTLDLHSDAVKSQIADKNVVAVIVNMTYDEDETRNGPGCLAPTGGSFAAEHGVGIIKKKQMLKYKDKVELEIMKDIKALLDPKNIINPGKIL